MALTATQEWVVFILGMGILEVIVLMATFYGWYRRSSELQGRLVLLLSSVCTTALIAAILLMNALRV